MAAEQAVKKLGEQLNCAICLDTYTDPKLLQCFHVYCKKCLVKLVIRDQQGQLILTCPTCRKVTLIPENGVSGLQSAFHINHLLELRASFEKVKVPTAVKEKLGGEATSITPEERVILKCSEHTDKELEVYCETCEKVICFKCLLREGRHNGHNSITLDAAFNKYLGEIISSLEPVEKQLTTINSALTQLDTCCEEILNQRVAIENDIHNTFRRLHKILDVRMTELISDLHQMIQSKLKDLATQRDQIETTQAQLSSCLDFMRESLKKGYQAEVLMTKNTIAKQVKELTATYCQADILKPKTEANMRFFASSDINTLCQNYGKIAAVCTKGLQFQDPWGITFNASNNKVYVTDQNNHCIQVLNSDLTLSSTCGKHGSGRGEFHYPYGIACDSTGKVYVADFNNHRIQVFTAEGEFLRMFGSFGQSQGRGELSYPIGVAVDTSGRVYVSEWGNHRVSVFTSKGQFLMTFGKEGKKPGEFIRPSGLAVDSSGVVYVCERQNRIQNFGLASVVGFVEKKCGFM